MCPSGGQWSGIPLRTPPRHARFFRPCLGFLIIVTAAAPAEAVELGDAQKLFWSGKYADCIDTCSKAIESGDSSEGWWVLKARAELTMGRYEPALKTTQAGVEHFGGSLHLWLLNQEAYRANDRTDEADAVLATVQGMAEQESWRFQDAANRVALGRVVWKRGGDARQVLETYFDRARKDAPDSPEPLLAIGELALEKEDYAVAAGAFRDAAKLSPEDPDVYFGLARAQTEDAQAAATALAKALELNPHHPGSLLMQAAGLIDREDYASAELVLKQVLEVNPKDPRAWAYRAVLAQLAGDGKAETAARAEALSSWKTNPEVDYLIGRKLSDHYRFAQGAAHQKMALEFAANYGPAKFQLCQDLLRLGKEEEGWKLVNEVFKEDPYNVTAFNLVTLHDHVAKFNTLTSEHFQVRMDPLESQIYGKRVLDLLARAREKLTAKYGVELPEATTIEIFPEQKDFAIRTFGLPGGEGFLGVCFGPVVTVNSPAGRMAAPENWEAILWHEFCHTVTLTKTQNKMPRWLSEGISVYEERQEVSSWGEHLNPVYREMILKSELTPVSQLSTAFMRPPTPLHLQFAYYEASMVVEYINSRFGAAALNAVLTDLANDVQINEALARHTEPIDKLDTDFAAWLMQKTRQVAPTVDWEEPKVGPEADSAVLAAWNREHVKNFPGLLAEGRALLEERKWAQAVAPLEAAAALYPEYSLEDDPYLMLAAAHRELAEPLPERAALEKFLALNSDAVEPRLRYMELAAAAGDWKAVRAQAEQALGINPLIAGPHRYLAQAAEALGDRPTAIAAHRTLLLLDHQDTVEQHYRLGRLLFEEDKLPEARREVVLALEEAPRYRAAHSLLLQIAAKMEPPTPPATEPAATAPGQSPSDLKEQHP